MEVVLGNHIQESFMLITCSFLGVLTKIFFFFNKDFGWCVTGDFPGGSESKDSACNAGHASLIPGLGRSLGEGNGHPLQYSCLENSMDRILAGYCLWGCKEVDTTE